MPRRPPPVGAPRWGVTVIVVGVAVFAGLLPVAINRGVSVEEASPAAVEIQAATPTTARPSKAAAPQSSSGEISTQASSPPAAPGPTTTAAPAGTTARVAAAA